MQNAQPTTNCAKWILKVVYLSISKQQKNFGVSKMQGGVTIGHMATRLISTPNQGKYEKPSQISIISVFALIVHG